MPVFEIGNKAAEKWTEEQTRAIFMQMMLNAKTDEDILCIQDAIASVDLYVSSVNYLIEKFPVFEKLKEDLQNIIIQRINRGALKGYFNPTASIWRMKQSGETDEQKINHQNDGGKFEPNFVVNNPGTAQNITDTLNGK